MNVKYLFITLCLMISASRLCDAQNIDYLSHDYEFLDESLNIDITAEQFDSLLSVDGVKKEVIVSKNDSLSVITYHEFEDYSHVLKAYNTIKYSWLRLAYHLWMTEDEAKNFAKSIDANSHPWRCMEAITASETSNILIHSLLEELKRKVEKETGDTLPNNIDATTMLSIALKVNPKRKSDLAKVKARRAAYEKEHGKLDETRIGVGCGKPNCCQK